MCTWTRPALSMGKGSRMLVHEKAGRHFTYDCGNDTAMKTCPESGALSGLTSMGTLLSE